MYFKNAICRELGKDFEKGLTTSTLGKPDFAKAKLQHEKYVETLKKLGLNVDLMPELSGFPDAVFVEDTAIVTEDIAVITYPGAKPRVGEIDTIETVLKKYRKTTRISNSNGATIDGGDVLRVGDTFFVGISGRTNEKGLAALNDALAPFKKYKCIGIPFQDGLHLKSFVNIIADNTVIVADWLADNKAFDSYKKVVVGKDEEYASNCLLINDYVIAPLGFPKTAEALKKAGVNTIILDTSEYRKMDGALTCLSLRF